MIKPTCSLCQGKVTDNTFIWLPENKLVHVLCYKIKKTLTKDIVVNIKPIRIGVKGRM